MDAAHGRTKLPLRQTGRQETGGGSGGRFIPGGDADGHADTAENAPGQGFQVFRQGWEAGGEVLLQLRQPPQEGDA